MMPLSRQIASANSTLMVITSISQYTVHLSQRTFGVTKQLNMSSPVAMSGLNLMPVRLHGGITMLLLQSLKLVRLIPANFAVLQS
ncbi:hypothetical protein EE076_28710 [Klebsiella pneumoniae]|nr:hypothetical protein [Klebsiella pneumoniae]NAU83923.1 hypothetical protein [Klebsiella pneumoniae]NAU95116.1 hypothetical protein [Klebsiella pneumoniae]NAV06107.1 hypothetical protein [Klebsiella pneumoniae]NAV27448.1 hypothetical protein [Klebsiella pneumoniae]